MATLNELNIEVLTAKIQVVAVENSINNLPAHRYTKLLAVATTRYEIAVDKYVKAYCS